MLSIFFVALALLMVYAVVYKRLGVDGSDRRRQERCMTS
jgi:hypothetical protein